MEEKAGNKEWEKTMDSDVKTKKKRKSQEERKGMKFGWRKGEREELERKSARGRIEKWKGE